MAVSKDSAAQKETVNIAIAAPPSVEEFCERRRRKRKSSDEINSVAKEPTICTTGVSNPQFWSKLKVSTGNFFSLPRLTVTEVDYREADDTTERRGLSAPWSHAGRSVVIHPK